MVSPGTPAVQVVARRCVPDPSVPKHPSGSTCRPPCLTRKVVSMRKTASIVGVIFGLIFVVAGVVTWIVITSTLSDQKITVSDDADCRAGATVAGPVSAYCQTSVIDKHTMEITGGKTYAELDREDPNRDTAMTSSFLQASLFTSVVAFGVAAMAVAIGIAFVLFGLALREPQVAAARRGT